MKKIITLLLFMATVSLADNYVIVSGLAWHQDKENIAGDKYDTLIEGIGYQYRDKCEMLECSATALFILDSNSKPMGSVTIGTAYPVTDWFSVGVDVGIGYKYVYYYRESTGVIKDFKATPVGIMLPKVEFKYKDFMLNIGYIPKIDGMYQVTRAVYANVGIKF